MKKILLIYFLFLESILNAQNLVNDGSFEEYKRCPQNIVQDIKKFSLVYWNIPTKGTTDYFSSCSHKEGVSSVPNNQYGKQEARTGNGYVAIGYVGDKYGEYIESELTNFLIKDEEYYIEYWVSLADYSMYKLNSIGAYFSKERIRTSSSEILDLKADIEVRSNELCESKKWIKISSKYKARGGEKYIIIGGFISSEKFMTKTDRKEYPKEKAAYYYVDDVLVQKVKSDSVKVKQFISELNKPIILENITFEFAKSVLQDSSFVELDRLVSELKEHTRYQITLSGYTDNIGKEEDNLKLSVERAKAVAEYLISQGIEEKRVIYKGYGSLKPIADNEIEEGRKTNRRVEFIIKER
ncbi:MAG: OmpA family protein [Flavobacteriales bacterium]|nr:OmpA family protein [Flavobacteriales bacterium]MCB9364410.1 OmpA family protein [Flavobacteriales bacterium]